MNSDDPNEDAAWLGGLTVTYSEVAKVCDGMPPVVVGSIVVAVAIHAASCRVSDALAGWQAKGDGDSVAERLFDIFCELKELKEHARGQTEE